MLAAEAAVFHPFKPVRIVLLVLRSIIVSLFALRAGKSYPDSHTITAPPVSFASLKKATKEKAFFHR
jgi:hypothetical protein